MAVEQRKSAIEGLRSFKDLRDEEALSIWNSSGFVAEDEDGNPVFSREKLTEACLKMVKKAHVASSTQKDDRAYTKWVFITKVVPELPVEGSDEWEQGDTISQAAWKAVARKVWNEVQDVPGGAVQKLLKERQTGLTLCKGTILVGPEKKTPAEAVYVTDDGDLLMADYSSKRSERARLDMDRFADHMAELVERHPELAVRVEKEVTKTLSALTKRVKGTLEAASPGEEAQAA